MAKTRKMRAKARHLPPAAQFKGTRDAEHSGNTVPGRPISEEERVKILQEKGVRIPAGTPIEKVNDFIEKAATAYSSPVKSGTISWKPGDIPSVSGGKSPAMDFSEALLRGDPVATKLAERAMNEMSLADKFIASTYQWAKTFDFTAKERKLTDHIPAAYRQAMRQAHRFELDNDFVRYATEVSNRTRPEKMLYRLQFANLPYDKTWIEFDLKLKVEVLRAYHGLPMLQEGVSNRMGVLLERVDDMMATVVMVCEALDEDQETTPNLTGYIYSLDERRLTNPDKVYNGNTPFAMMYRNQKILKALADDKFSDELLEQVSRGALWGFGKEGIGVVRGTRDFIEAIRLPEFLAQHGEVTFSRFYDYFELARRTELKTMKKMSELISSEISEFSGMMRWLITILAMLNEIPVRADHVMPQHQIKVGLTERRPALDFHRLTLKLPKLKPVPFIERKLSNVERHHKAHEVRQHWRTYLANAPCDRENHKWEYDYNEGYRLCEKCMSFSRLIHEHIRGNPELGWVRKDYVIRPTKQE